MVETAEVIAGVEAEVVDTGEAYTPHTQQEVFHSLPPSSERRNKDTRTG